MRWCSVFRDLQYATYTVGLGLLLLEMYTVGESCGFCMIIDILLFEGVL